MLVFLDTRKRPTAFCFAPRNTRRCPRIASQGIKDERKLERKKTRMSMSKMEVKDDDKLMTMENKQMVSFRVKEEDLARKL